MVFVPEAKLATWEDWERAYESATERHYSLSPHWGRVVAAHDNIDLRAFRFEFPEQEVVLPCFVTRKIRGVLHGLLSMPVYHYGGFLSPRPLNADITRAAAASLRREWLLHTLYVSSSPGGDIAGLEQYQVGTHMIQVLELAGGFGEVWSHKFGGKQRNDIRRAQRSGVAVRKDASPEAVASLYDLYLMTCRRQGVSKLLPKAFFDHFVGTGGSAVELWLAAKDGQDIAGIVVVNNDRDAAEYRIGASDKRFWQYDANRLLLSMAIEEACGRGYKSFDFGSSKEISSLEQFKASFGAVRMPVAIYKLQGRLPSARHWTLLMLRGEQAASAA